MNTTFKIAVPTLITAILIFALVAVINKDSHPAFTPTLHSSASATGSIQPGPVVSESPQAKENDNGSSLPLAGIQTFGQLQRKLLLLPDEASRLRYLTVAAAVCEGHREAHSTSYGSILLRTASGRYYARRADRFCSDFTGSQQEYELALTAHEESDVVQARELLDLEAGGIDATSQQLGEKIILNSSNAMAIYDAGIALTAYGTWTLGRDLAVTPQQQDMLSDAQWIAAQLLACDVSGGCGPDGLTTLIECGGSNVCAPGVTVRSVLAWESSPVAFELAEQIHAQLRALRANAGH